jgi:tripartite-type tricarboxylate transporter receptor subunit TctC
MCSFARRGVRTTVRWGLALLGTLGLACCSWAQAPAAYPSKLIRIVVPFSAGSGVDVLARVLAEKLGERVAQPVIVDNKTGAAGVIGFDYVAKAAPDGYTLLVSVDTLVINPALRKVPYDPIRDFAPIMQLASGGFFLAVHPSLKTGSVSELVALSRANPGKLNYSSAGVGSLVHLATEYFKMLTGADLVHIPHKGVTAAATGLVTGDVAFMIVPTELALPHIKAGKIKALAVSGTSRSPLAPDVPTVAEAGIADFNVNLWFGLLAPAGTPKEIVAKLNAELTRILDVPETRNMLSLRGIEAMPGTPEQFARLIAADLARWRKVVETARIAPE